MLFLSAVASANPTRTKLFSMGRSTLNRNILGITVNMQVSWIVAKFFTVSVADASDRRQSPWHKTSDLHWWRDSRQRVDISGRRPVDDQRGLSLSFLHILLTRLNSWYEWGIQSDHSTHCFQLLKPQNAALLRVVDFIIVPNVNPDGYEYSRSTDRLWRKTRCNSWKNLIQGLYNNIRTTEEIGCCCCVDLVQSGFAMEPMPTETSHSNTLSRDRVPVLAGIYRNKLD